MRNHNFRKAKEYFTNQKDVFICEIPTVLIIDMSCCKYKSNEFPMGIFSNNRFKKHSNIILSDYNRLSSRITNNLDTVIFTDKPSLEHFYGKLYETYSENISHLLHYFDLGKYIIYSGEFYHI
jgi:hypothetical protein